MLRVIQHPLLRFAIAFMWLGAVTLGVQAATQSWLASDQPGVRLLGAVLIAAAALGAYIGFVRVVERRPVTELSTPRAAAELAAGVLVGGLLFTVVIGLLWVFGIYRVAGTNAWSVILPALAGPVISGVSEELVFRGAMFRIAEERLGSWLALAISALTFGLLHLTNPNATLVAGLAIAMTAGVSLAAGFMLTRRLWLPMGMHFAVNFTQGGIFGVAVSGRWRLGLLQGTLQGPPLLSGGEFGAEASLITVIVGTVAAIAMLALALKRGHVVRPFWRQP